MYGTNETNRSQRGTTCKLKMPSNMSKSTEKGVTKVQQSDNSKLLVVHSKGNVVSDFKYSCYRKDKNQIDIMDLSYYFCIDIVTIVFFSLCLLRQNIYTRVLEVYLPSSIEINSKSCQRRLVVDPFRTLYRASREFRTTLQLRMLTFCRGSLCDTING